MITASRWRGGAGRHLPASRWWAPALVLLLVVAAALRARYGIDFGDSSHAVALAMRLAQGDVPFRDEMNLQVLGSWPAVPFTWAWLHVVGLDGIVLASRVWFVVLSVACGYVAWRAVFPLLGRGTTAAALAIALIPAAYNQQVVSYNTTPALMYVVAAGAGTAAVTRRSTAWGVVAGVATVLGAVSHPVTAPAAVALLLAVAVQRRGRVPVGVLAGSASAGAVVVALAAFVWGLPSISDTVSFTESYQSTRISRDVRLDTWLSYYGTGLASPWIVAALALGVLAALLAAAPRLRWARTVLVAAAVVACGIHALLQGATSATYSVQSWYSAVLGTVLLVVLLPVTLACAVRGRGPLTRAVVIGLSPTLVGMPFVAAFTSAAPRWGPTAAVLAPGLFVAVLAALVWVESDGRVAKAAVGGALVAVLGAVHLLNSYRDAPQPDLVASVPSGAFAGLVTTESQRELIEQDELALGRCASRGEGVLAYLFPAAFLLSDVRFDTPIIWTVAGPSSDRVLTWIDDTGRVPDCVVAGRNYWPGFGRSPDLRMSDPLRDWMVANYRVVSQTSQIVVLRRDR